MGKFKYDDAIAEFTRAIELYPREDIDKANAYWDRSTAKARGLPFLRGDLQDDAKSREIKKRLGQ
jgi:hypothetical protein